MKIIIEIECDNAAFEGGNRWRELKRILAEVPRKVAEINRRKPCLCDAPEASDKLLDINGNTVGKITVQK
jgi:hypothetical protein